MARRKTVKPIDLTATVDQLLKEYGEDVYQVMDDCVQKVSDQATEKLKDVSMFAPGGRASGEYSSSWTAEQVTKTRTKSNWVVHNLEHYRLTHLLEKGHVIRNGTQRTYGETGAYPHIAPVNDWANEELPRAVARELGK